VCFAGKRLRELAALPRQLGEAVGEVRAEGGRQPAEGVLGERGDQPVCELAAERILETLERRPTVVSAVPVRNLYICEETGRGGRLDGHERGGAHPFEYGQIG